MDTVAFNSYTEFFTHTHSMCHFLQSEAWQRQAENTIYRLTESSAGVAEQLQSTRLMAEDLIEAQSAALQAQKAILSNGEELRVTLRDSTQGLRSVFSELSSASREQQVALSELFNRVSFLQSFLLMETHSLSSCCYNAAALCTSFLITSTPRSSRARDPVQQSLQVLQQLRETQRSLQEALQHAESLGERRRTAEDDQLRVKMRSESRRRKEMLRRKEERREEEEREDISVYPTTGGSDPSNLSHFGWSSDSILSSTGNASSSTLRSDSHNASVPQSPGRRPRRSSSRLPQSPPSSPLVYSILVEDKQPRYSLRSRRSDIH
uniref:Uncharacterized protein n=1 Tax=Oreochromis niloticus TaxID=8128 RepID=A0A669AW64_ORENI